MDAPQYVFADGNTGKYIFKVNGRELSTNKTIVGEREILRRAKDAGAVPYEPENYFLLGNNRKYKKGEYINIIEATSFIAIPNTPTMVGKILRGEPHFSGKK